MTEKPKPTNPNPKVYATPECVAAYNSGKTLKDLAATYSVSMPTVRNWLMNSGVQLRPKGSTPLTPRGGKIKEDVVRQLVAEGVSLKHIADRLGVVEMAIHRWVRRWGIHTPRKNVKQHTDEILADMRMGIHVDTVAAKFNTSRAMIYGILDRAGVDWLPEIKAMRAAARPSKEEREKLRYAREKARAARDPRFAAYLQIKKEKANLRDRVSSNKYIAEFKAQGCKVCGEKEWSALDAHHRNPAEKLFLISHGTRRMGVTEEALIAEIAKCDCLCAYCHRIRHYDEKKANPVPLGTSPTAREVAKARIRLAPIWAEFRKNGCAVCGRDHPAGLSAHHVDPATKLFEPSRAIPLRMRNDQLEAELAKCICLCESCHRKFHSGVLALPTCSSTTAHSKLPLDTSSPSSNVNQHEAQRS
jgi:transposase